MPQFYHKTTKKSTVLAIFVIFLAFLALANKTWAKTPADPKYTQQAAFFDQIGASTAWDYTTGNSNVVVAIIDTGADIWHGDLRDNVWVNLYEVADNNYDDDGNGYIDDVNGWNFVENNNDVRTSVLNDLEDPEAIKHGTVIAGLVGAKGENAQDGVGVAWNARIMALRAMNSDGSGSYYDVARAVMYAADNGVDVINLSFVGNKYDQGLRDALRYAYERGVVIIAATGNEGQLGLGDLTYKKQYPVCFDEGDFENWIIGVSSINSQDVLSKFSNYGSCVDLLAPGEELYSSERYAPMYGFNDTFGGPWKGTSFATPIVSGAAALIKSIHPAWSVQQIINALLQNTDNVDSFNSKLVGKLGSGKLNIGKAVASSYQTPVEQKILKSENSFSYKDNIIYIFHEGEKKIFTSINEAQIVGIDSFRSLDNKRDEIVVLIRRGKYFYAQFFTDTAKKWKEMALPLSDYNSKKIPQSIKAVLKDGAIKLRVNFKEQITKKKSKETEKLYDR
jgi:subtilisin family serine protease